MGKNLLCAFLTLTITAVLPTISRSQIEITEVDAAGSTASTGYAADWFELKNVGSSAVDITGWKIDDNSSNFVSAAVSIREITSIAAGQSIVFIEGNTSGSTDASIDAAFTTAWFGANVPSGLVIGNYGGSGVGLSQTADAVNIFDSTGGVQAYVSFGASALGGTFDNTAGINGVISTFSQVGVNGAFTSANGLEVGSPDGLTPTPEPSALALGGLGAAGLAMLRRRRNK
jgi:hypothetical protein